MNIMLILKIRATLLTMICSLKNIKNNLCNVKKDNNNSLSIGFKKLKEE